MTGDAPPSISVSVSIHVIGMFGFSLPLGRLTDRLGRPTVMLAGLAIAAAGGMMVGLSDTYPLITAGTFLVGLGWSCGNIATTALLADTTTPAERGRAIGANDTFSSASGIALPLIGSVIADQWGMAGTGLLSMLLVLPPALMLLRLREVSPGRYDLVPTAGSLPAPGDDRPPIAVTPDRRIVPMPSDREAAHARLRYPVTPVFRTLVDLAGSGG